MFKSSSDWSLIWGHSAYGSSCQTRPSTWSGHHWVQGYCRQTRVWKIVLLIIIIDSWLGTAHDLHVDRSRQEEMAMACPVQSPTAVCNIWHSIVGWTHRCGQIIAQTSAPCVQDLNRNIKKWIEMLIAFSLSRSAKGNIWRWHYLCQNYETGYVIHLCADRSAWQVLHLKNFVSYSSLE